MFQQITFAVISIELCPLTAQEEHLNLLSNQSRGRQLNVLYHREKKCSKKNRSKDHKFQHCCMLSAHTHKNTHCMSKWNHEEERAKDTRNWYYHCHYCLIASNSGFLCNFLSVCMCANECMKNQQYKRLQSSL